MPEVPCLPPLSRAEAEQCALTLLRDRGIRQRIALEVAENGGPPAPVPFVLFQSAHEERYVAACAPEARYRVDDRSWRLWAAYRGLMQAREFASSRRLALRWLVQHVAAPETRRGRPPKPVSSWARATKRHALSLPGLRKARRAYREREAGRSDRILPLAADERRNADEALIQAAGEKLRTGPVERKLQTLASRIAQFQPSEGDEVNLANAIWGFWYQRPLEEWRDPLTESPLDPDEFPCGQKRAAAIQMGFCLDGFDGLCPAWRFAGRELVLQWAIKSSFDQIPAYDCGGEVIAVSVENRHLLDGTRPLPSPVEAARLGIRVHPLEDARLMAWFREHAKSAYI